MEGRLCCLYCHFSNTCCSVVHGNLWKWKLFMSLVKPSVVLLTLISLGTAGYTIASGSFSARKKGPTLTGIPQRSGAAPVGSRFIASSAKFSNTQREAAIVKEITRGNIPDYLRHMQTVTFQTKLKDGRYHQVEMNVMPDYLAIGSDKDFVRIPMSPLSAQQIADRYKLVLPTAKLVDEIYKNASLKYAPSTLPPGKKMVSNDFYRQHNQLIEKQRKGRTLAQLSGGQKKDVVITNRLKKQPGKVAIYGWHRSNGKVIQPLSLVHGDYYADYSHGIRLIDPWIKVDGKRRNINAVLNDSFLAPLVSGEGKMLTGQAYRSKGLAVAKLKKPKAKSFKVASVRKKRAGKKRS